MLKRVLSRWLSIFGISFGVIGVVSFLTGADFGRHLLVMLVSVAVTTLLIATWQEHVLRARRLADARRWAQDYASRLGLPE